MAAQGSSPGDQDQPPPHAPAHRPPDPVRPSDASAPSAQESAHDPNPASRPPPHTTPGPPPEQPPPGRPGTVPEAEAATQRSTTEAVGPTGTPPAADSTSGTKSTTRPDPADTPTAAARPTLRESVIRLLSSPDADTLLATAIDVALAGIAPDAGAVFIADEDGWLRLAGHRGMDTEIIERFPVVAPDSPLPLATAVREQRAVYGVAEDLMVRYPDLSDMLNVAMDYVVLPLMVDDRCLGGLVVRFARISSLSAEDEQLLAMVADVFAHRLEHLLVLELSGPPAGAPVADSATGRLSRRTRLELAMSSGNIGAFEWDISTGTLIWDERTVKLFGIESEGFDSRITSFLDAIHPDDRAPVQQAIEESMKTGEYHVVCRAVWPDGTHHWLEAKGKVERTEGGEPGSMVGVVWDITEQREREGRREARREFVLRVTSAFAAALTTQDVLDAMTGTVLPELGAHAIAIHIELDGRLLLAGAAGYPDETMERLRLIGAEGDGPMAAALRAGHPLFFRTREEYVQRFPDQRFRPSPGHQALVFMPLASADGTVGTCLISYAEPRDFGSDDQIIIAAVGGILAQSLARARLSDLFRHRMTELQELMMPRTLDRLAGYEIAARYLPAAEGMQVGGDWFDMMPREGGGASFVIGDVQGHSAQAAGVMGQLRTALRAHASDGYRAEHLMARGNQTLWGLDTERFATCCIVDVAPPGDLQIVRAGHPSPLQCEPDGTVRELEVPGGLPLGYAPDDRYPVFHGQLRPGATLLLYTDGLVDRPDRPYETAVAAVSAAVSQWMKEAGEGRADASSSLGTPLEELAHILVSDAFTDPGYDDVAVLLIRRLPLP
ncbi:SpoIIE family protein phosphatase [Streptomyces albipurpureus]|uniref:SpoIIE family protein phosphatase n=1 Tax=Streptomyces albipurpureus TaxID=2897419 RepID=A0ABT0UG72_9ACTN|nr:SpoIIE family protein phosphatase [Streptomyces sp. CWNU-1]MCM2387271.1 SpoIIE family protein phosphatase [Streptomyces sp. CWNU-1]